MLKSCLVLAGGASKRFGKDKLSAQLGGKTLLELLLSNLEPHFRDIFVIGSQEHPDELNGGGPLAGIYTGLRIAKERSFVIGGDMPFFNPMVAEFLSEKKGEAVIPRYPDNMIEPLYAFYDPSICNRIEEFLEKGRKRIRDLLSSVKTTYVNTDRLRKHDPNLLCFFNLNKKEDMQKARKLLQNYKTP